MRGLPSLCLLALAARACDAQLAPPIKERERAGTIITDDMLTGLTALKLDEAYLSALQGQLAKLTPPTCGPPGGDRLKYTASEGWTCICEEGWRGVNCSTPPLSLDSLPPPPKGSRLPRSHDVFR